MEALEACRWPFRSSKWPARMTNSKRCAFLFLWMLAGLLPLAGFGEELGDPAPPVAVKEWVKGPPVEIKAGTNIYVVVIWDTKNSTGRAVITNLNNLLKKYKDQGLVIAAISDETPEKLKKFVESPDVQIDYSVGADIVRRTAIAYMLGFKLRNIPQAFVVSKEAKLLWHGDPLRGLAQVLDQVVTGKYDIEQAKKNDAVRTQLEAYRAMAHRGDPRARAAGELLISGWTNNVRDLCDFAYFIISDTRNSRRDFALANQALEMAEKLSPTNTLRLFATRAWFLFETGKHQQAIGMLKDAIAAAKTPTEKSAIETHLQAMEARLKSLAAKAKAAGTNAVGSVTATNAPSLTNSASGTNVSAPKPSPREDSKKEGKNTP